MKAIIDMFIKNLSSEDHFQFGIVCEHCRDIYTSLPERFSKADLIPESHSKQVIYATVYEQEMSTSRQKSLNQLAEHMNRCPICKRLVCNKCFLICDDLDMCVSCASNLKEAGVPVSCGLTETNY